MDYWAIIKRGALLVDVRSPQEYAEHIDGAINIPHDQVESRIAEFGSDKEREIVLYCKVGGRANMAKKVLEQVGFKNVFNAGGYDDLKNSEVL